MKGDKGYAIKKEGSLCFGGGEDEKFQAIKLEIFGVYWNLLNK